MDYQNRVGSKKGSGGVADDAETNEYRRERLRKLLMSKINIDADPYVVRNRMGVLECRLCFTTHMSEGSYITHTHGKKHQMNLMRRAEMEKKKQKDQEEEVVGGISDVPKRRFVKIGRPAYKITKIRDPVSLKKGITVHLKYERIKEGVSPRYRLMSSFEQKKEEQDPLFQYLIVSGEPYENVAFKIPSDPVDLHTGSTWDFWDPDTKEYFVQLLYK